VPYYQLKANVLEPGDVVLEAGAGKLPWLIKLFDHGKLSPSGKVFYHVLIFLGSSSLLEATRKGVGVVSPRVFVTKEPNDFYILRHPAYPQGLEDVKFVAFGADSFYVSMWREVNKKYNYLGAILVILSFLRHLRNRESLEYDSYFCSQLVAEAYRRVQVPLFEKLIDSAYVTPNMFISGCKLERIDSDKCFDILPDLPKMEDIAKVRHDGTEDPAVVLAKRMVKTFGRRVERLLRGIGKVYKIRNQYDLYEVFFLPDLPDADAVSDEIVAFLEANSPFRPLRADIEVYKKNFEGAASVVGRPHRKSMLIERLDRDISSYEKSIETFELAKTLSMEITIEPPFKWRSIHEWLRSNHGQIIEITLDILKWSKAMRHRLINSEH
jgi:hypothetical protein